MAVKDFEEMLVSSKGSARTHIPVRSSPPRTAGRRRGEEYIWKKTSCWAVLILGLKRQCFHDVHLLRKNWAWEKNDGKSSTGTGFCRMMNSIFLA
jgi:hypothetical protein